MEPQRRERRRTHLDASAVPVERALLARAQDLERQSPGGLDLRQQWLAAEWRKLAEELHYW